MVEVKVHFEVYNVDTHEKILEVYDVNMMAELITQLLASGWVDNIQIQTVVDTED